MNINYKILLLLSCLSVALSLNARGYQGGRAERRLTSDVRFGINIADMDIKGFNDYRKSRIGFNIGWYVNYKFHRDLQIQTGLVVSKKGMERNEFSYSKDPTTSIESFKEQRTVVNANYIQLPINLGWEHYFSSDFALNLNIGPYLAYGFKGKGYQEGSTYNAGASENAQNYDTGRVRVFKDGRLKKFDLGLNASVGFIYDIYALTVGYEHGLSNISDSKQYSKVKNKNIYISVGFRF